MSLKLRRVNMSMEQKVTIKNNVTRNEQNNDVDG